jgi:hypothetical protein
MGRHHLSYEQCLARYPRLARLVAWTGILSSGEAGCAIRDFRDGYNFSGEAVNHFGGTRAIISAPSRTATRFGACLQLGPQRSRPARPSDGQGIPMARGAGGALWRTRGARTDVRAPPPRISGPHGSPGACSPFGLGSPNPSWAGRMVLSETGPAVSDPLVR